MSLIFFLIPYQVERRSPWIYEFGLKGVEGGRNIHTQRESHFIAHLKTLADRQNVVLQGCVSARISKTPPGAEFTLLQQEYVTSIRPYMSTLPWHGRYRRRDHFFFLHDIMLHIILIANNLFLCKNVIMRRCHRYCPSTSTGMWRGKVLDILEATAIRWGESMQLKRLICMICTPCRI